MEELHSTCTLPDKRDDPSRGTALLSIYSLKIQYASRRGDYETTKALANKTKELKADVADPKVMCIINEELGEVSLLDKNYVDAYSLFHKSMKDYQSHGSNMNAKTALAKMVFVEML